MPNLLTLTSSIQVPNMTKASIVQVLRIDKANNVMAYEVQLSGPGGVLYPGVFAMTVTNGTGCDALVANPSPTTILDSVLRVSLTAASTPGAFTAARNAYRNGNASADDLGQLIAALQAISGIVQGGPLNGQTVPILPPGPVT